MSRFAKMAVITMLLVLSLSGSMAKPWRVHGNCTIVYNRVLSGAETAEVVKWMEEEIVP